MRQYAKYRKFTEETIDTIAEVAILSFKRGEPMDMRIALAAIIVRVEDFYVYEEGGNKAVRRKVKKDITSLRRTAKKRATLDTPTGRIHRIQ